MPLSRRFTAAGRWTDPKQNCTHQFDTACYAITHAAAWDRTARVYDVEIPLAITTTGATAAALGRRRAPARVDRSTWNGIVDAAPPFDAAPWRGGFMRWADATCPKRTPSAAIVLRRACDIGMGRGMDLDGVPVADATAAR